MKYQNTQIPKYLNRLLALLGLWVFGYLGISSAQVRTPGVLTNGGNAYPVTIAGQVAGAPQIVADMTALSNTPVWLRATGQLFHVLSPASDYRLVGGTNNANWQQVIDSDTAGALTNSEARIVNLTTNLNVGGEVTGVSFTGPTNADGTLTLRTAAGTPHSLLTSAGSRTTSLTNAGGLRSTTFTGDGTGIGKTPLSRSASVLSSWEIVGKLPTDPALSIVYEGAPTYIRGKPWLFYGSWTHSIGAATNYGTIRAMTGDSWDTLVDIGIVLGPSTNPTNWDRGYVNGPRAFEFDGTNYLYYFAGISNAPFEFQPSIGVAISSDGTNWTRPSETPMLDLADSEPWESGALYCVSLFRHQGTFYLFYNAGGDNQERIGFATGPSPLGPFTRYAGNPVLISPTGSTIAADPNVFPLNEGGWGMMFRCGISGSSLASAYSSDLITWTNARVVPYVNNTVTNTPVDLYGGQMFEDNGPALAADSLAGIYLLRPTRKESLRATALSADVLHIASLTTDISTSSNYYSTNLVGLIDRANFQSVGFEYGVGTNQVTVSGAGTEEANQTYTWSSGDNRYLGNTDPDYFIRTNSARWRVEWTSFVLYTNANLISTAGWGAFSGASPPPITAGNLTTPTNLIFGFDVKAYGAIGNGVVNDSAAIQRALDAAAVLGGVVHIPAGVFLATTLTQWDNVEIRGVGRSASILKAAGAGTLLRAQGSAESYTTRRRSGPRLADVSLDGNRVGTIGCVITDLLHFEVAGCNFESFNDAGLLVSGENVGFVDNSRFFFNNMGYRLEAAVVPGFGSLLPPNLMFLRDSYFYSNTNRAVKFSGGTALFIDSCNFEVNGMGDATAVTIEINADTDWGIFGLNMDNCWLEGNTGETFIHLKNVGGYIQHSIDDTYFHNYVGIPLIKLGGGGAGENALIINDCKAFDASLTMADQPVEVSGVNASVVIRNSNLTRTGSAAPALTVKTDDGIFVIKHTGTLAMDLQKIQAADDGGYAIALRGGTDGLDVRGYVGYGHRGAGSDTMFTGEIADALVFRAEGALHFGTSGDNIRLTIAADGVTTLNGSTIMAVAKPLSFASGTNQRAGTATLVGGTVTVGNTTVTANTIVIPVRKTAGGTIGDLTYTLSAGTSFTINSDSGTDTSIVSYLLIENP